MSVSSVSNKEYALSKKDLYVGAIPGVFFFLVGSVISWPKSANIAIALITTLAVAKLHSYQRFLKAMRSSYNREEIEPLESLKEQQRLAQQIFPSEESSSWSWALDTISSFQRATVQKIIANRAMAPIYQEQNGNLLETLQVIAANSSSLSQADAKAF